MPKHRSSHLSRRMRAEPMNEESADVVSTPDTEMPTWMDRVWRQLRSAFLIGTVVSGIVVGAIGAYREAFPPKEGATAEEVDQSMDNMRAELSDLAGEAVRSALREYTDSLQVVRTHIEDSVARPIYKAILDLDRRTTRIERRLVEAGLAIEEQKVTAAATAQELLDQVNNRSSDNAMLEALSRMEERIGDRMDDIERRLPEKRTSRFKTP